MSRDHRLQSVSMSEQSELPARARRWWNRLGGQGLLRAVRSIVTVTILLMSSGRVSSWSTEQVIAGSLKREVHGFLAMGLFTDGRTDLPPQGPVRVIRAYARPEADAKVLVTLTQESDVEALETSYELMTAVVYDQRPGWFQVKTRAGIAWVPKAECGRFTPIEDLLRNRMTYLIVDPQVLYRQPDYASARIPANAPHKAEVPATMLEWKWSQGQAWIQVRVHASAYEDPAWDGSRGTTGWLPAYQNDRLVMWFYARGM